MKIRTMIPAIIALFMLMGGPFGLGTTCSLDTRGGLVCYCCSAMGENCTMISCSGCCGAHAGDPADRPLPEMIPESSSAIVPAKVVYGDREKIGSPEAVYLEVPDKPPEKV